MKDMRDDTTLLYIFNENFMKYFEYGRLGTITIMFHKGIINYYEADFLFRATEKFKKDEHLIIKDLREKYKKNK